MKKTASYWLAVFTSTAPIMRPSALTAVRPRTAVLLLPRDDKSSVCARGGSKTVIAEHAVERPLPVH